MQLPNVLTLCAHKTASAKIVLSKNIGDNPIIGEVAMHAHVAKSAIVIKMLIEVGIVRSFFFLYV